MYSEADEAIGSLEKRMLDLAISQLDAFEGKDGEDKEGDITRPLPPALVNLLLGTHKAIFMRMSKRRGIDLEAIKKNPRLALVQLEKERVLIMKLIEQTENQGLKLVEGGHK